jgi:mannose-6-phosphate isomerase-like protein (cupin superfamily)
MNTAVTNDLAQRMKNNVGRYAEKVPDWDAFPASRGFPELTRSQVRYIGAGGAHEKTGDAHTLPPVHFTLSVMQQPVGKYGAAHAHECKEAFLVLDGVLTIGWEWDGEVILARCGPKDMCLHDVGRPHGFRNEGVDPVMVSVMVGKARPLPPQYTYHPKTHTSALSWNFGAEPGRIRMLDWDSSDPRDRDMAQHVVRYSQQRAEWQPAGFARMAYIGEGGAPPESFRMDLIHAPRGVGVQPYARDVEEAYFVLEGVLTAGWEENGRIFEQRLGPRDLMLNPPGQMRYFRNESVSDAQFMMIVGTPKLEDVRFKAASR